MTHAELKNKWCSIRVVLTSNGAGLESLANGEAGSKNLNQGSTIAHPRPLLPIREFCGLLLVLFNIAFTYSIIW